MSASSIITTLGISILLVYGLTRILELSRENIKDDAQLHNLLTKIISLKHKGILTMKDYDEIIKQDNNELESIIKLAGI